MVDLGLEKQVWTMFCRELSSRLGNWGGVLSSKIEKLLGSFEEELRACWSSFFSSTLESLIHSTNISNIDCLLSINCPKHWRCHGVVNNSNGNREHTLNPYFVSANHSRCIMLFH